MAENEHFVTFAPYAPRFPFETWILPKRHESAFENSSTALFENLASTLKRLLAKADNVLDDPAYNLVIHTSPVQDPLNDHYHWHIEIMPKLTKTAGFEWGTGFYINPTPPEEAAQVPARGQSGDCHTGERAAGIAKAIQKVKESPRFGGFLFATSSTRERGVRRAAPRSGAQRGSQRLIETNPEGAGRLREKGGNLQTGSQLSQSSDAKCDCYLLSAKACSRAWAVRIIVPSSKWRARSCIPMGNPSLDWPQGMEIPGTPARSAVTV